MLHVCGLQIIFYILYAYTFEKFRDICHNATEKYLAAPTL